MNDLLSLIDLIVQLMKLDLLWKTNNLQTIFFYVLVNKYMRGTKRQESKKEREFQIIRLEAHQCKNNSNIFEDKDVNMLYYTSG